MIASVRGCVTLVTRHLSPVTWLLMLLSEDKLSHLSHVILDSIKASKLVRLRGDEALALREIKRVLAEEAGQEEEIDRHVRARLASYSRPMFEGSAEWDTLYRKAFEEEARRRRKSG